MNKLCSKKKLSCQYQDFQFINTNVSIYLSKVLNVALRPVLQKKILIWWLFNIFLRWYLVIFHYGNEKKRKLNREGLIRFRRKKLPKNVDCLELGTGKYMLIIIIKLDLMNNNLNFFSNYWLKKAEQGHHIVENKQDWQEQHLWTKQKGVFILGWMREK